MLELMCDFVHNYFEREVVKGTFNISGGTIVLPSLLEGQRFKIVGSSLNDGIYTYHAAAIKDADDGEAVTLAQERFSGTVIAMGVPKAFIDLAAEISAWVAENGAALSSPYQSESFGGYSYTMRSGGTGANGGSGTYGWQDMFRSRLNTYRKIA